jgi:hypothetical protein
MRVMLAVAIGDEQAHGCDGTEHDDRPKPKDRNFHFSPLVLQNAPTQQMLHDGQYESKQAQPDKVQEVGAGFGNAHADADEWTSECHENVPDATELKKVSVSLVRSDRAGEWVMWFP